MQAKMAAAHNNANVISLGGQRTTWIDCHCCRPVRARRPALFSPASSPCRLRAAAHRLLPVLSGCRGVVAGRTTGIEIAKDIVDTYLATPFEGGQCVRLVFRWNSDEGRPPFTSNLLTADSMEARLPWKRIRELAFLWPHCKLIVLFGFVVWLCFIPFDSRRPARNARREDHGT